MLLDFMGKHVCELLLVAVGSVLFLCGIVLFFYNRVWPVYTLIAAGFILFTCGLLVFHYKNHAHPGLEEGKYGDGEGFEIHNSCGEPLEFRYLYGQDDRQKLEAGVHHTQLIHPDGPYKRTSFNAVKAHILNQMNPTTQIVNPMVSADLKENAKAATAPRYEREEGSSFHKIIIEGDEEKCRMEMKEPPISATRDSLTAESIQFARRKNSSLSPTTRSSLDPTRYELGASLMNANGKFATAVRSTNKLQITIARGDLAMSTNGAIVQPSELTPIGARRKSRRLSASSRK